MKKRTSNIEHRTLNVELNAPLQIEELNAVAVSRHNGILHEAVWQMVIRRDRITQGVQVDEPPYTEDQGLDRFLPDWAVSKLKKLCRGGE